MLKTIKISHPENDVWFFSDFHARHDKEFVWGKRGFKSAEDHYEGLIARWNERVTNQSIAVHLGDMMFGDLDGTHLKGLLRRLNFRTLYLLPGNHISGYLALYKETIAKTFPTAINHDGSLFFEVYPLHYNVDGDPGKNIIFVTQYTEFQVNGKHITTCHYPIVSHNHMKRFSLMLCGHSHGSLPLTNKETGQGLRLDVGPESFGRPVSLLEIKAHLRNRDIDSWDHHAQSPE